MYSVLVLTEFFAIVSCEYVRFSEHEVDGRHYHAGHRAVHVTRLNRYDHSGPSSMIEAEEEWHRSLAAISLVEQHSGATVRRHGEQPQQPRAFLQLSPAQVGHLKEHQRSVLLESVGSSLYDRELDPKEQVLLEHLKMTYKRQVAIDEEHPATIRLSNLNSQYVGPIGVGTTFNCQPGADKCEPSVESNVWVVLDTGSTNIWISSDLCTGPCSKPGRMRYNHTRSLTFHQPKEMLDLSVRFGTGEVSGPHAVDDFRIGPFTVTNQTFAMIESQTGSVFEEVPFEGILGLAFKAMSANKVMPFFDTVIERKALQHNEFAFYFNRALKGGNAIFWGGIDPDFHNGPVEYFPVVDPYYWSLRLHAFEIGHEILLGQPHEDAAKQHYYGDSLLHTDSNETFSEKKGKRSARNKKREGELANLIVDTGTTYFTAETGLYEEIMARLPSRPCDEVTDETHPPITYYIGNANGKISSFTFSNREYMTEDDQNSCSTAFMRINVPRAHGPGMVLGELFLRSYFTVFDRGNGAESEARVGFAPAAQGDTVTKRLGELTSGQKKFYLDDQKTP